MHLHLLLLSLLFEVSWVFASGHFVLLVVVLLFISGSKHSMRFPY